MELFAQVVKTGLTFTTVRGTLTPQDVWQLPLTGNNGFNLDTLSREVLKKVRATQEESLVTEAKVDSKDELRLEVLKFIIEDKQSEAKKLQEATMNKQKKEQLLMLKAKKQAQKQDELTEEEIDAQLAELN